MNNPVQPGVAFPEYSGLRCLMMPYIQGDPTSVPDEYGPYSQIISSTYLIKGDIGFLTIDESFVIAGQPHRGARAKYGRAIHTEVGLWPSGQYGWGGIPHWGDRGFVTLNPDVEILLASNMDNTCAIWNTEHFNTSVDGDIGDAADMYPYEDAVILKSGEVRKMTIFTPHESLPAPITGNRQFLRIVGSGVHGREPYFTTNSLMENTQWLLN